MNRIFRYNLLLFCGLSLVILLSCKKNDPAVDIQIDNIQKNIKFTLQNSSAATFVSPCDGKTYKVSVAEILKDTRFTDEDRKTIVCCMGCKLYVSVKMRMESNGNVTYQTVNLLDGESFPIGENVDLMTVSGITFKLVAVNPVRVPQSFFQTLQGVSTTLKVLKTDCESDIL